MGWEPISRTVGEGRAGAGEITGSVGARAGLMLQRSVVPGVGLSLWALGTLSLLSFTTWETCRVLGASTAPLPIKWLPPKGREEQL